MSSVDVEAIRARLLAGAREVRVLSLWQPWASLIACGAKRFETRSWQPRRFVSGAEVPWRGLVAIHAARTTIVARNGDELQRVLERHGLADLDALPRGSVVALAELWAVTPTDLERQRVSAQELAVGDWRPGRWAWDLEVVGRLSSPIPNRGSQGLRRAPRELEIALAEALLPSP